MTWPRIAILNFTLSGGVLFLLVLLLCTTAVTAQEEAYFGRESTKPDKTVLNQANGKISVSTMGAGATLSLAVNKSLVLKGGFEYIAFTVPVTFDENNIDYTADLDYNTGNLSLLLDWYVTRTLYLTGGCGYNLFKPHFAGKASDDWKYGDIYIPKEEIGDFRFTVTPSVKISPYFGAGIGRFAGTRKNVTFSLEAGAYYQGEPDISIISSGLLSPTSDRSHQHKELLERQFSIYNFYPVIKMGLSFVLFKM